MADSQTYLQSLGELRNDALLLVVANAHICEDHFIVKIGKSMYKNAQILKDDISRLRKDYPGKLSREIETDSIINKINETAQSMLQPSEDLIQQCASGQLGHQIETEVKSIAGAVKEIRDQIEGKGLTHDKKTSGPVLSNHLENVWDSLENKVMAGLKVLLGVLVIAALAFGYLFLTMERGSKIQKNLDVSEAHISGQRRIISELESEKEKLMARIEGIEKKDLIREEKIEILDLKVDLHGIDEKIHSANMEIEQYNEKISKDRTRLDEIKRKSFMERLLRR